MSSPIELLQIPSEKAKCVRGPNDVTVLSFSSRRMIGSATLHRCIVENVGSRDDPILRRKQPRHERDVPYERPLPSSKKRA